MALVIADRVKETTTTTGTGTYTLLGAVTGFETFASVGDGNTTYYCCTDGTDFEVGVGTYTASGTTLARTTILQSSNSDAAVNWTAGTRTIFVTLPAEKAVYLDASGNLSTTINTGEIADNAINAAKLNVSGNGTTAQFLRSDGDGTFSWATPTDTTYTNVSEFTNDAGYITGYTETDTLDSVTDRGATTTNAISTGSITTSGQINLPNDHYVNRQFQMDAVDANGTVYILLCRNAGGNDVNGTITMDRTSGLRHACQVDIIVSAGSSASPIGSLRAHGVAGNGEPTYQLVTVTYSSDSNSYVALKIVNPDNYHETSGAYFTGRIVNSGSNTLTPVTSSNISNESSLYVLSRHSVDGTFDVTGNITVSGTVDGRDIAADGTTLDAVASTYVNVSGDTMTGDLAFGDNVKAKFGAGNDLQIYHDSANSWIANNTGTLAVQTNVADASIYLKADNGAGTGVVNYVRAAGSSGEVQLYHYGSEKLATKSTGIDVTGNITVSGTVDGRDVAADGTKLDGIATGAEVNQNAFSNVAVSGQTTVAADAKTDTLTLAAGSNVTITTNATTDTVTIASTDTTYSTATATTNGLVKIEDNTTQSVAANAVSSTAGRTYGVQLNSSGQMVVNVPWADTNTTYTNVSEFTNDAGYLTSVAFTDIAGAAVQTSGESFSDSDTVLMTAAAIEDRYLKTSSVVFPFFKSDGSSDTIPLTADSKLPFFKADTSASNISLTT